MLKIFIEWVTAFSTDLRPAWILDAIVTLGDASDNQGARLDIETLNLIARITFWESGDYHSEVINLDSEQQIYSYHGTYKMKISIEQELKSFFAHFNP